MTNVDEIEDRAITVVDPVCGKAVDLNDVVAHESYGGWAYFFCSAQCRNRFLADPGRYASAPAHGNTADSSQHET